MKVTKFQHACLVIEKEDTTIVIDPGRFSRDLIAPKRIDAIVITHEHDDHLEESRLRTLLKSHPKAVLVSHQGITARFPDVTSQTVAPGDEHTIGSLGLRFFGGSHAVIAEGMTAIPNLAVLVDGRLYYPGDSFVVPENISVAALALPISAPWLKLSEATSFLARIKPQLAFPTHDALLSDDGKEVTDRLVGMVAQAQGIQYRRLDGSSIELA